MVVALSDEPPTLDRIGTAVVPRGNSEEHRDTEENGVENAAGDDEDKDNRKEEAGTVAAGTAAAADTAVLLPNTIVRNDEDNRTSILCASVDYDTTN